MSNTFPKTDKLCGQLRIQQLYQQGKKFSVWPLRVTYCKVDAPTQVLVWAPKSLFHHAVDRNRLRRLMREAWRLHHQGLEYGYRLAFNYMDHRLLSYDEIERSMQRAIRKLQFL